MVCRTSTTTEPPAAPKTSPSELLTPEELQLAARNHGMPLEALRYPVTPLGLHYLLIHYDIPAVDPAAFRLTVDGAVDRPLELSLDDLRARPATTAAVTFECAGNGRARLLPRPLSQPWLVEAVGTGQWTGVALRPLLEEAGLQREVCEVVFTGLDRGVEGGVEQDYARSLRLEDAFDDDVILAYALNGEPLPPQHGFPLRLLVPRWYGMANVKWLTRITAVTEHFAGFQNERGYRLRTNADDPGQPVTRMAPRALLMPPGIPDFMTRRRLVGIGPCRVDGRAWSGRGDVVAVEVSVDGGATWQTATLEPPVDRHAWCGWSYEWNATTPGEYELCCRAIDSTGARQPDDPVWNLGGYENNALQRVPVTVGSSFDDVT
jgi:DMSO/TMAO reductase YedYZ molybdopterin-dependent catalytic subunit